jgi:hypothetical protein
MHTLSPWYRTSPHPLADGESSFRSSSSWPSTSIRFSPSLNCFRRLYILLVCSETPRSFEDNRWSSARTLDCSTRAISGFVAIPLHGQNREGGTTQLYTSLENPKTSRLDLAVCDGSNQHGHLHPFGHVAYRIAVEHEAIVREWENMWLVLRSGETQGRLCISLRSRRPDS